MPAKQRFWGWACVGLLALTSASLACGSSGSASSNANAPTEKGEPVGTNITLELPTGDVDRGERLAETNACTACHVIANTGPAWQGDGEGIGTRAAARIEAEDYTGQATTAEQYLFEAIVLPSAHLVTDEPTYAPNGISAMPSNYGNQLSKQELADIIAYMLTLK